ncbi:nucleotide pyrophosphohydrolase [Candidatus Roizmanbacteria bacterium]|nr:nucleotide pyrophosphohydrolase [Candidatus Roizmanbacteria bacterium]
MNSTFSDIYSKIKKFIKEREWEKFHNPKDMAEAIVIEASELLELFLWKDPAAIQKMLKEKQYETEIREEVADILIYTLQLVDLMGYDIKEIVEEKMKKNERKYPVAKAKGNSRKYTNL